MSKSQTDDDNCSVICYKDSHDEHVGVIRIRQQPVCPACNIMRPTITAYYKHLIETTHRETVKKLCDENKYQPSVYDQVIHLAFSNNLHYQSPKFHFLYKHATEDADVSIDIEKSTPINARKRRNFQVSLVFQEKIYSQIGPATAQIREQLFKDLANDRAEEIARLSSEIYYTQKKFLPSQDKDQSFENDRKSSETDEQLSQDDDFDCKLTIDSILRDIYSKSEEFRREQRFYSGIARRAFRKKNTFYCDICEKLILSSEKHFLNHFNDSKHLEKFRHYQIEFLPWRRAMQQSLITEQSVRDILGNDQYEQFKQTMANYLAPNSLSNRGRFCCGFCELIFTDQWALEKHLHSIEHKEKQTSVDHKELILNFANSITLPIIFKYNGIKTLSEIPEDIRIRFECRAITRAQYDDDVNTFIRNYPFDTFEGATRLLSNRAARRQRANQEKNGGQRQTSVHQRGTVVKRTFPHAAPTNKRFRPDLNSSYPGANRGPGLIADYPRPLPYNNRNPNWPTRYSNDQQRQEFFDRPNYPMHSDQNNNNNNNGFYAPRPTHPMSNGNNYNPPNRQINYNDMNGRTFNHQQNHYDQSFARPMTQSVPDYRPMNGHSSYLNNNNFPQTPPMNPINYHPQNSYNNSNPPFFQSPVNQQPNNLSAHSSYADYRASSALPTTNSHPSMYPPTSRTFDEFGLSAIANSTFNQTSWRGGSRDTNNRGRQGGGHGPNPFPTNKQAAATFSYSSSSSNVSTRGRGAAGRTFHNRY